MARRLLISSLLAALACVTVALASCGSSSGEPASLAPKNTPVYVEFSLAPEDNQKAEFDRILGKVFRDADPGESVKRLLEQASRKQGNELDFDKQVEPWLGDYGALIFVPVRDQQDGAGSGGAVILACKDNDKAEDFLKKGDRGKPPRESEHEGVKLYIESDSDASAIVDDFVVSGDEAAVRAVIDASKGDALADEGRYRDALERAPDERLGFVYLDPKTLLQGVRDSGGGLATSTFLRSIFGSENPDPIVATATAEPQGVQVRALVPATARFATAGQPSPLLEALPGDAWAAFASVDVGQALKKQIESASALGIPGVTPETIRLQLSALTGIDLDKDLLDWMGDFALYASGTNKADVRVALVIESTDPAASQRGVAKLASVAKRFAGRAGARVTGGGSSFRIQARTSPQPVEVVARGDRVVIGYGPQAIDRALNPSSRVGDSENFRAARQVLGSDVPPSGFLAVAPLLAIIEAEGAGSDPEFKTVQRYLSALSVLAAGAKKDGDRIDSRFAVGVP